MTKKQLEDKAQDIFENHKKETVLYCIEDGNFWLENNKFSAELYSKKLGLELQVINKGVSTIVKKKRNKSKK